MHRILILIALGLSIGCGGAYAERPAPEKQISAFIEALKSDGPQAAVDKLIGGSLLQKQKGAQIAALIPQFETAIKVYGNVERMEQVDEKRFGPSFIRYRFITYHTSGAPLFWRMMFFRTKDGWEVHVFAFNDDFDEIFKDA
jgi:hypothetical protein